MQVLLSIVIICNLHLFDFKFVMLFGRLVGLACVGRLT